MVMRRTGRHCASPALDLHAGAAEYGRQLHRHADHVMQPELNIYVCSTVRHLLFALLRSDLLKEETHHILFFADYQHTSLADWHLDSLPVKVIEAHGAVDGIINNAGIIQPFVRVKDLEMEAIE